MGAYVYTLETGCQTCQHFDQDARPDRFELQNFALMASASWLNEVGVLSWLRHVRYVCCFSNTSVDKERFRIYAGIGETVYLTSWLKYRQNYQLVSSRD